jgi:hypothetical protein
MLGQQEIIDPPGTEAVREELDRLLASHYFNQSRRFPTFLRFVVEHTLAGDVEQIKERTLGIEIFGRDANYDTASDPIVRVTAAEIRKRVAQYYQDPAHRDELRISLPSGSYVPHFHWPSTEPPHPVHEHELLTLGAAEQAPAADNSAGEAHGAMGRLLRPGLVAAIVLAAVLAALAAWRMNQPSPFDAFWRPVLSPQEPVLLCIADQLEYSEIELRDAADPAHQFMLKDQLTAIVMDDLDAIAKVAGILQAKESNTFCRAKEQRLSIICGVAPRCSSAHSTTRGRSV